MELFINNDIVTYLGVIMDGVWIGESIYWPLNTHHSELQGITALSLISPLYKPPQHPLSLFRPAVS
jgi:hypothetical protein